MLEHCAHLAMFMLGSRDHLLVSGEYFSPVLRYLEEMLSKPPTTKISPPTTAWPWESRLLRLLATCSNLPVLGSHTSLVEKSSLMQPAIW